MARIAHVIDGLGSGGAEALLVTNLRAFRAFAHEHVVITMMAEHTPLYPTEHFWAREISVPLIALSCRTRTDIAASAPRLAGILSKERIDVVHTHLAYAGLSGRMAGRFAGARVVSSLHQLSYEPEVIESYRDPRSKKHVIMQALEAVSLRQAHAIVAVGEAVRASAIRRLHLPPSRVRVIKNPVDFQAADAAAGPDRRALLGELGITGDPPLLVNVGRLVHQKNQRQLVREIAALKDAHLVLLGAHTDTAYVQEVQHVATDLGMAARVHLVGVRKDVPAWLRAADVFVFPSHYEGLAVALIEATGQGCACVASDIAPNREVITHDETGLLAPISVPGAFGQAVARLLGDRALRERLGAAAKAYVRRTFDPHTSVAALQGLYSELLSSKA